MSNAEFQSRLPFASRVAISVVDELVESQQGYARGGERSLLGALLFDGVQAYISHAVAMTAEEKSRFAEGHNWVMDSTNDTAFSFNGACEALGISPEYLRSGLRTASESLLLEVGKTRRTM